MRVIRLTRSYIGWKTGERRIAAGDYADSDPRLFGAADYLLETGHAQDVTVHSGDTAELPIEDSPSAVVEEAIAEESTVGVTTSRKRK